MSLDRFHGVIGTAGHEPTIAAEQWPQQVLVGAQQRNEQRFHDASESSSSSLERATSLRQPSTPLSDRRNLITTSSPSSACCRRRNRSRTIRRNALRSTARGRKRLLVTRPSRALPGRRANASSSGPSVRLRPCRSRRKTPLSHSLAAFGKRSGCEVGVGDRRASDGQTDPALGATRAEDLAATDGLHPGAEAVRALALDDGRLVSAFHDFSPIFSREKPCIRTFFRGLCQRLAESGRDSACFGIAGDSLYSQRVFACG